MYLKKLCFLQLLTQIIGVDHCAENDHGCEQLCLNTDDSYVCQCSEGFVINEDLRTCSRKSSENMLALSPHGEGFCFHTGKRTYLQGKGRDAIQRHMDTLQRWACAKLLKFNEIKRKVLNLHQGNPKHEYWLGHDWIESNSEEKDLEVQVDAKLNMRFSLLHSCKTLLQYYAQL